MGKNPNPYNLRRMMRNPVVQNSETVYVRNDWEWGKGNIENENSM